MDLNTYKLIHILGILLVFQGIGTAATLGVSEAHAAWKKLSTVAHGVGVLLLLVAGFGMMARLGLTGGFPAWIWVKLLVWIVIAALPFALRRKPEMAKIVWGTTILLGFVAGYMALFKPFA